VIDFIDMIAPLKGHFMLAYVFILSA